MPICYIIAWLHIADNVDWVTPWSSESIHYIPEESDGFAACAHVRWMADSHLASLLLSRPNVGRQSRNKQQSTQVAINPLQDAGWRSTSFGGRITISFNSLWTDVLNILTATVFILGNCLQWLPNVIYNIELDSLFFLLVRSNKNSEIQDIKFDYSNFSSIWK